MTFFEAAFLVALAVPAAAQAQGYAVVYNFNGTTDGSAPAGTLLYHGGSLYGTTAAGGAYENGAVFKIDLASGAESVLYSFMGGRDGRPASIGGVIVVGDSLFGVTSTGGTKGCGDSGCGTIYRLDLRAGTKSVLHEFDRASDGQNPATLTYLNGFLFGTTRAGDQGVPGPIVAFKIDAATGRETILHTFAPRDGLPDRQKLVEFNGLLYGEATAGGQGSGHVNVFTIDPVTGTYAAVHKFGLGKGSGIIDGGLTAIHGTFYGLEEGVFGCTARCGAAYAFNPRTGQKQVGYTFNRKTGPSDPVGQTASDGAALYGETTFGGASDGGVLFRIDPATGSLSDVYDFPNDGSTSTGLTYAHGALYGSRGSGGTNHQGIIFKYTF